jgi:hypothetical protein
MSTNLRSMRGKYVPSALLPFASRETCGGADCVNVTHFPDILITVMSLLVQYKRPVFL